MLVPFPPRKLVPTDLGAILVFTREEVMQMNTESSAASLAPLVANAQMVCAYEGRIEYLFRGYEDDDRVLVEIPEVREFFERLTDTFPYWLHFCVRSHAMSQQVLALLTPATITRRVIGHTIAVEIDPRHGMSAGKSLIESTVRLYRKHRIARVTQARMVDEMRNFVKLGINRYNATTR